MPPKATATTANAIRNATTAGRNLLTAADVAAQQAILLGGYATETYVDDAVAAVTGVDLTDYALKTYVIAAIAAIDYSGYATAAQGALADTALQPSDVGTAAAQDVGYFATAAQGAAADSAVQPGDLAGYAPAVHTHDYYSLTSLPLLGTAALQDIGYFATSAQGTKADSAIQPDDIETAAYYPYTAFATASQGTFADSALQPANIASGTITAKTGSINFNQLATSTQGALADTAVQPGDLHAVATSGDYNDLSNLPTLGTAAASATGDFATAAQGALADTAFQPTSGNIYVGINKSFGYSDSYKLEAAGANGLRFYFGSSTDPSMSFNANFTMRAAMSVNWVNSINTTTGTIDTSLQRGSAGVIDAKAGATKHSLKLFRQYTAYNNLEALFIENAASSVQISTIVGTSAGSNVPISIGHKPTTAVFAANVTFNIDQTTTFGSTVICAAGTTSISSLRIPAGVSRSSPTAGDVWNDGTNLVYYANSAARKVASLDVAQSWTQPQVSPADTITFASTISHNATSGSLNQTITLTGNITDFQVTGGVDYQSRTFWFVQDATGGRTVVFSGIDGTEPVIDTTADVVTRVTMAKYPTTGWRWI